MLIFILVARFLMSAGPFTRLDQSSDYFPLSDYLQLAARSLTAITRLPALL